MIFNVKKRKKKQPAKRRRAPKALGALRAERDNLERAAGDRKLSKEERGKLARLSRIIFAAEKAVMTSTLGEAEYQRLRAKYGHKMIWEAFSKSTAVLGQALEK